MLLMMDKLSKFVVNIDEAVTALLGIALYVAPDAADLLKIDDGRENGDDHLHISTKLHLSGIGSIIVTVLIARYVLCKHAFIAKFQILFTVLVLPLLLEADIVNPGGCFSSEFFSILFIWKLISGVAQTYQAKKYDWIQQRISTKRRSQLDWQIKLLTSYLGALAISRLLLPIQSDLVSFNLHPPMKIPDVTPFMRWCCQLEGVAYTALFCLILVEMKRLPQTCLQVARLLYLLMIPHFIRALAGESTVSQNAWQIYFILHICMMTIAYFQTLITIARMDPYYSDTIEWAFWDDEEVFHHSHEDNHIPLTPPTKMKKSVIIDTKNLSSPPPPLRSLVEEEIDHHHDYKMTHRQFEEAYYDNYPLYPGLRFD